MEWLRSSKVYNSLFFRENKKYICTANPNSGEFILQSVVSNVQIFIFVLIFSSSTALNIPTVDSFLFYFVRLCFRNIGVGGFVCLFAKL